MRMSKAASFMATVCTYIVSITERVFSVFGVLCVYYTLRYRECVQFMSTESAAKCESAESVLSSNNTTEENVHTHLII